MVDHSISTPGRQAARPPNDDLNAARGIANGTLISISIYGLIAVAVILWLNW